MIAAPGEKAQAMGGAHDDYGMALGIALMVRYERGIIGGRGKVVPLPMLV